MICGIKNLNGYHNIQDIQPVKSRLKEIRHDHKDTLVPIGEFLDNSKDWGLILRLQI